MGYGRAAQSLPVCDLDMQALVTALCWRPDGKQLAAGHANGSISILDVETGDVVSENKVHYASIATLQWSDQAAAAAGSSSTAGHTTTSLASKLQLPGGQLLAPQHSILPHQRFKRLFAPPELNPIPPNSTEPLPDPYDLCMELAGAAAWPAERPGLSLLCAGDARGHISLWLQVKFYGGVCYMDIFFAKQQWHCPPGSSQVNLISCDPPRWFAPPTPG